MFKKISIGFCIVTASVLLFLAFPQIKKTVFSKKKPNIILISLDTQRTDRLPLYGYSKPLTPNLDALAQRGAVVFKNHYSDSFFTLPSHMSIFTGQPGEVHQLETQLSRRQPDPLNKQIPVITEFLKKNGYQTAGAWDSGNHHLLAPLGFGRGIDEFFTNGLCNEQEAQKIAHWIKSQPEDQPFFLFLHQNAAHGPYMPEKGRGLSDLEPGIPHDIDDLLLKNQSIRKWDLKEWSAKVAKTHDPEMKKILLRKISLPYSKAQEEAFLFTYFRNFTKAKSEISKIYDFAVFYSDWLNGFIFNALQDSGKLNNTLIVIVSDHGEELGERQYFGHYAPYDETARTVFILLNQSFSGIRKIDGYSQGFDVAPTILDFAKTDFDREKMFGKSLLPYIENGTEEIHGEIFAQGRPYSPLLGPARMLQDLQWKVVAYANGHRELFPVKDHKPDESKNFAEEFPLELKRMLEKLEESNKTLERFQRKILK